MSLYYEDEFVELHLGDCRGVRGWTVSRLAQQAFIFEDVS